MGGRGCLGKNVQCVRMPAAHPAQCPGTQPRITCLLPHLQPIRRVRLYEPEADRVVVRAPGFRTIRGVEEEEMEDASLLSSSL